MGNKLLLISFIATGVSLYYTYQYDYGWINFILIATSIIFGVCLGKYWERKREVQEPSLIPKTPEELKMEEEFPIR